MLSTKLATTPWRGKSDKLFILVLDTLLLEQTNKHKAICF